MKKDEMIIEYLSASKEAKRKGWKVKYYKDAANNNEGIIDLRYTVWSLELADGLNLEVTAEWLLKNDLWVYNGLRVDLNHFDGDFAFKCKTFGDFKAIEELFLKQVEIEKL